MEAAATVGWVLGGMRFMATTRTRTTGAAGESARLAVGWFGFKQILWFLMGRSLPMASVETAAVPAAVSLSPWRRSRVLVSSGHKGAVQNKIGPVVVVAAWRCTHPTSPDSIPTRSREYPIRWYAERICELTGYDPSRISYDTSRYTGVRSKQLSTRKLKKLLPEFELTPIEEALGLTVEWFRDRAQEPASSGQLQ